MSEKNRKFHIEMTVEIVCIIITIILVLFPLVFLLYGSFSSAPPGGGGRFYLDNYRELFKLPWYWQALKNSLICAVSSTVISSFLGIVMGWIVSRTNVPLVKYLEMILITPLYVSPFVGAVAWHLLGNKKVGLINVISIKLFGFGLLNINSLAGISIVLGLYYFPYMFLFVSGALKSMDPSLEESSRIAGSGIIRTAYKVTLPLILPAIFSGVLLVFALNMGNFSIPVVLGWADNIFVLTTKTWQLMSLPPINYGFATVISVVTFLITGGGDFSL